jgi:Prolipoprotein diacylglyceryl transferase
MFNNALSELVRTEVHLGRKSWPAFQVCGLVGLASSVTLTAILVAHLGFSLWVMGALILSGIFTFLGLAMVTKIITGYENLIYYYHEIAILIVFTILLKLLRQPVLAYLDFGILGISAFLVFGRVGCLMVGCCYGKPCRWGVSYRKEHAVAGFPRFLVGVRLFPIQGVESLWALCLTILGTILALRGNHPGEALALYVSGYGLGRFCFEFMRGDQERRYFWGFSEAQWISLILICILVNGELAVANASDLWRVGANACLVLVMIAVIMWRRVGKKDRQHILCPSHIKEVIEALDLASAPCNHTGRKIMNNSAITDIHLGCTSLGIRLSASKDLSGSKCVYHYAISRKSEKMTEQTARTLARLILQVKHPHNPHDLIYGSRGVFHLLVYPASSGEVYKTRSHSSEAAGISDAWV